MVKHTTIISFLITFLAGVAAILVFPYYTINPGVLIEDHLNLQNDCFACHSLGQGALTQKCISCHKIPDIGIITTAGASKVPENLKSSTLHQSIINIQCFDCHTEHNGLSRENATLNFTHNLLPEDLLNTCVKCHADKKPVDDLHKTINADCSNCHQTDQWQRVEFKHELIGNKVNNCSGCHRSVMPAGDFHKLLPAVMQCKECHNTNAWKPSHFKHELLGNKKNECRSCHEYKKPDDALHNGIGKSIQCVQCHTTDKWKPSTFDHTKYFRFDNNHPSNCSDCHNINKTFETYTCYNCHEHTPARIEREHLKEGIRNFSNCGECHRSGEKKEAEGRERKRRRGDKDNN